MANNFASIFLAHLEDVNDATSKFFTNLYECKRLMLMLENLYGEFTTNKITQEDFTKIKEQLTQITTLNQLTLIVETLNTRFHDDIPNDTYEYWSTGDYKGYTDQYHHRQYWNHIENHPIIDMLIEQAIKIFNVTSEYNVYSDTHYNQAKCLWNLRLYDFNDYDLYFETEENLSSFLNTFENLEPCTVSSRTANETCWHEKYSI
mgnify:FL=1